MALHTQYCTHASKEKLVFHLDTLYKAEMLAEHKTRFYDYALFCFG